jgi:predicted nucleic acid-binding protein
MPAKVFLDTNVLAYTFDQEADLKRERAKEIIKGQHDWVVSWQVIQEFSNVALHRFDKSMRLPQIGAHAALRGDADKGTLSKSDPGSGEDKLSVL